MRARLKHWRKHYEKLTATGQGRWAVLDNGGIPPTVVIEMGQ